MVSFPQVSPPKPCMHLSSPPFVLHAPQWTSHSTQFDPIITASTTSQRIVGNWQLASPLHVGCHASRSLVCEWHATCVTAQSVEWQMTGHTELSDVNSPTAHVLLTQWNDGYNFVPFKNILTLEICGIRSVFTIWANFLIINVRGRVTWKP